jgi:D-serine deaminase-like pyridoxal phosphate-dependent protein
MRIKRLRILAAGLLIGVLIMFRPTDMGAGHSTLFSGYQTVLKQGFPGKNIAFLDRDRLNANLEAIRAKVHPSIALRLVSKSLPSLPLLSYLMEKLGTDKLMVFSEPYLERVLERFGTSVDILLGKPLPADAAARLMARFDCSRVCWLIDSEARLESYEKLQGPARKICVEVDVGLKRGGFKNPEELHALLKQLNPAQSIFGGLMGYDGHVGHSLPVLTSADKEFAEVLKRYKGFLEKVPSGLIQNSGGSNTFWRYSEAGMPVNEIALGSAFVVPSHFSELEKHGLKAALFLAAPVLKKLAPELPFIPAAGRWLALWDINFANHFFLLGGGWPADVVSPSGLKRHFLWDSGDRVQNLLPNQPLVVGSSSVGLEEGDLVFFRPWEGDALVGFDRVEVISEGSWVESLEVFHGGN